MYSVAILFKIFGEHMYHEKEEEEKELEKLSVCWWCCVQIRSYFKDK